MNEVGPSEGETPLPRIGEVVESASHRFTAQCYRLYQAPPLGAFVRTGSTATAGFGQISDADGSSIYAVVNGVSTQALDPGRPIIARGEEQDSEEGVYRDNPQLARLLCTRFEALVVGHRDGTAYNQRLPAFPPRIHAFVYVCNPEEVNRFTDSLDFIYLLVNSAPAGRGVADEVVAACLRQASGHREDSRGFLVAAGKALAVQLAGDLPRLNSMLRKLSP